MDTHMIVELIGYFGSALVLLSFLMTSVVKLRIINMAGGVICTIYSLVIHAYPTAIMNTCLVLINFYYLMRIRKTERAYDVIEGKAEESMLRYFVKRYAADIQKYFPDFNASSKTMEGCNAAYIVCHDDAPAGILIGNRRPDGELDVILDYSTPAYRDCSVGKYLYSRLKEQGIRKLNFAGTPGPHEYYLQTMGFVKEDGTYVKELDQNEN